MFDEKDLQQIREHGLSPEQAETQLENFRRGFPFLNVVRAASPGDGVLVVGAAEADAAVERYEKESAGLGVVKFVPASGAATRMFKELFEFVNDGKRGKGIDTLLENIGKFAFWPELRAVLPAGADDRAIVNAIVGDGLNYGRKPKSTSRASRSCSPQRSPFMKSGSASVTRSRSRCRNLRPTPSP